MLPLTPLYVVKKTEIVISELKSQHKSPENNLIVESLSRLTFIYTVVGILPYLLPYPFLYSGSPSDFVGK